MCLYTAAPVWLRYDLEVCRRMGIEAPRVALIHCTEKVNEKFPHTLDYVTLKERAAAGAYGNMYLDGPMDVKTACDAHSGEVKGISSPVVGHADLLIFPNIESGNTFYKTVSLFGDANMAGMLRGTASPVVVPSRADSGNSKYYSLALACELSVAAGVGVRYRLNDRFALFAEPSVSHHFGTDSETGTLRTERPTNLNLLCGVRMTY